jgi:hypothetical protein
LRSPEPGVVERQKLSGTIARIEACVEEYFPEQP